MIAGNNFQLKLTISIFLSNFPKREYRVEKGKIGLVPTSMVVTHYIKLFRTEADRQSGILMSLLLLVGEL